MRLLGRRSGPVRQPESPSASSPGLPHTGCFAPSVQLFLQPDGEIRPCCVHLVGYGNIADQRLPEIWDGIRRQRLVERLAADDFSQGCENCAAEIEMEGREQSYAEFFKVRAGHLTDDPETARWPRWMDFNLSTSCNLQCIQCSGELSSSIRIHREKRSPLPCPYGDEFFDDLRLFIPHLDGALFAGGEPFMAAENFRVWDLIAELRPELSCTVTTNATQWNSRVERVVSTMRMSLVFSLDALSAPTFEAIRVGADRDEVFANVDRFVGVTRGRGTSATVNHCLMVQNHHEFADLLMWAEERGLLVNVSVVRTPASCSIARLPPDRLGEVLAELERRRPEVEQRLRLNLPTWRAEMARVAAWAASSSDPTAAEWGKWGRTVLMFRCEGDGPHDDAAAREELAGVAIDGGVHTIDVGPDDLVTSASPGLLELVGSSPEEIRGRNFAFLDELSIRGLGPLARYELLGQTPDRLDAMAVYGTTALRIVMVALRDQGGRASAGRILVARVPLAQR